MEELPPDPLLKAGAFIDPCFADPVPDVAEPSTPVHNSSSEPVNPNADGERPDWLPPGWLVEFRTRTTGATAGHRDKYFYCPNSTRRFRSRKEVMSFMETGEVSSKKKKNDGPNAEITVTPQPSSKKRKKIATKVSVANFKIHEVPNKVTWAMTDMIEGTWEPLVDGTERVSEETKDEWAAVFKHMSLQKNGKTTLD